MSRVPAAQKSAHGVLHRISRWRHSFSVRESRVVLTGGSRASCGMVAGGLPVLVRDSSRGTWCASCGDNGIDLTALPMSMRRDEQRWAAMVEDIRRAVAEAFPERVDAIMAELVARAPVNERPEEDAEKVIPS